VNTAVGKAQQASLFNCGKWGRL